MPSGQVQDKEEKVNPDKKINQQIATSQQKIEKLLYPYDLNACNVPVVAFDGVDMVGVEVGPTEGPHDVQRIQIPGKKLKIACRPLSHFFEKTQESTYKHRMQKHLHGPNACGMRGANATLFRQDMRPRK